MPSSYIKELPNFSLPFDRLARPHYNPPPAPGYPLSHYRVEFFIKGDFIPPVPSQCTHAGDIYAPIIKIGPITFFASQKWDPPVVEGSCSTMASEPSKIHIFIDTISSFSNKTYRSKFKVLSVSMGNQNSVSNEGPLELPENLLESAEIEPDDLIDTSYYLFEDDEIGMLDEFSDHRFIIEWEYVNSHTITIHTYIDGNSENSTLMISRKTIDIGQNSEFEDTISSPANQMNWLTYNEDLPLVRSNRQFAKQYNKDYSLGLFSHITFGSFSFIIGHNYFKDDFPDSKIIECNESWNILNDVSDYQYTNNYLGDDILFPEYTVLSDALANSRIISQQNNTLKHQFKTMMIDGADQIRIRKIEVEFDEVNSLFKVKCLFGMPYRGFQILNYGNFKVDDWVELGRSKQPVLNRKWKIREVGNGFIIFYTNENVVSENCSMGSVILKQIAIRDTGDFRSNIFSWGFENDIFSNTDPEKPFSFSITDFEITTTSSIGNPLGATATATISSLDNELYLKRNMKNNFQIYSEIRTGIQVDPENTHWKILGSPLQLYFVIGYGRNSLSHHQLLTLGYIRDAITNQWIPIFQSYAERYYGNPGHNYAFMFSDWKLLDSGHLMCRNIKEGEPTSDARFIVFKNHHYQYQYPQLNKKDLGFHIYPTPSIEREILLPYISEDN